MKRYARDDEVEEPFPSPQTKYDTKFWILTIKEI